MAFVSQCFLTVAAFALLAVASPFLAGAALCVAGVLLIEARS